MTTRNPDPPPAEAPETMPPAETPDQTPKIRTGLPRWNRSHLPPPPSLDTETAGGSEADVDSPGRSDEPPGPRSRRSTSSRASSVGSPEQLREGIAGGILLGTERAHNLLVHDPVSQELDLLKADEKDADAIAEPAANIFSRRVGGDFDNPDIADGIALAIAVAGYLGKQIKKFLTARQARRYNATQGFEPAGEEPAP